MARCPLRDEPTDDLPGGLSQPAQRALTQAGYLRLAQLAELTEVELGRLHGVGPKAVDLIRLALEADGRSFLRR